jgi:hypothetical protein
MDIEGDSSSSSPLKRQCSTWDISTILDEPLPPPQGGIPRVELLMQHMVALERIYDGRKRYRIYEGGKREEPFIQVKYRKGKNAGKWRRACLMHGHYIKACWTCNPKPPTLAASTRLLPISDLCERHGSLPARCKKCKLEASMTLEQFTAFLVEEAQKQGKLKRTLEALRASSPTHSFRFSLYKMTIQKLLPNGIWRTVCDCGKDFNNCHRCVGLRLSRRKAERGSVHVKCKECTKYFVYPGTTVARGLCHYCRPVKYPAYGATRDTCAFLDKLALEWRMNIQHVHFDGKVSKWTGGPHWTDGGWHRKHVTGFIDGEPPIAIEFLFNKVHGHPGLLATHGLLDPRGREYAEIFKTTETTLAKLVAKGYRVYYIWESDWQAHGAGRAARIAPYCHSFDGKLRW